MCSRFLSALLLVIIFSTTSLAQLKVCADPDNLPYSNRAQQGFENKIAQLMAASLHTTVHYEWQRMGRGFVREFLNKHRCDVVMGVPEHFRPMGTTVPYYRSTYVFVTHKQGGVRVASFDDPKLKKMKIGVQVLSEEYAPPAQALGRRGLIANIVGFKTRGGNAKEIVDAVARKRVDAAVVWGPFAGYFARAYGSELQLTPTPEIDPPGLPLAFSISMGVRKTDVVLRDQLNEALKSHQREITRILRSYNVPLVPVAETRAGR